MRLIDAGALERKAKREATEAWKMSLKAPVETTLNQFIDWVKSAPTVSGWISVKDKLPDVDGLYLVYGMTDAMRELLPNCVPIWICDYYQEHGFYSFTEQMHFDYITHWMPLPEPPEEDEKHG